MRSSTRLILATCFLATACESVPDVMTPPSDLATPPAYPSHAHAVAVSGSVRMEAHFTDLRGGITQDSSLLNHLIWLIDNAPAKSQIRAAIYSLDMTGVSEALHRAKKRDVQVFVVMDGRHAEDSMPDEPHRLRDSLGASFRWCSNGQSLVSTPGWNGCIASAADANMHSKLFMFSRTRDATGTQRNWVVWFGSANPSPQSGIETYNNSVTVYGDRTFYDEFRRRYWRALWDGNRGFVDNDFFDRSDGRGFFSGSTFGLRVFASPQQERDLVLERIKDLKTGKDDPQCTIHVAQSMFRNARIGVARLLAKKSNRCRVVVAVQTIGPEPLAVLDSANIPVWCTNTHDKFFLLRGSYGKLSGERRLVFTGSHNFNEQANYTNDELLVRVEDPTMYAAFVDSWQRMTSDEDSHIAGPGGC